MTQTMSSLESANQSRLDRPDSIAPIVLVEGVAEIARAVAQDSLNSSCPQDRDCVAGGNGPRIFECQEGCGFRGCGECMEIHESEPHASDAATSLELYRNGGAIF